MPNFKLTEKQYDDIIHILMVDNAELADHPEFFKETGLNPRKFIDERIALCNAFEIDFWNSVDLLSTPYNFKRLHALYHGQSIKDFERANKRPAPGEFAKQMSRIIENENKIVQKSSRQERR